MNRRARIIVVWGLFVVLGAIIVVLETREPEPFITSEEKRRLFSFREPDIGQVDLFYQGRIASLVRSPTGLWLQHDSSHRHDPAASGSGASRAQTAGTGQPCSAGSRGGAPPNSSPAGTTADVAVDPALLQPHPEPDPAKAEAWAKAIDFVARAIYDRQISPAEPLREYGLDNPPIALIFYPREGGNGVGARPLSTLYVGAMLPGEQAYYTQLGGDRNLTLLPLYQVNTLVNMAFGEVTKPPPQIGPSVPSTR